MNLSVSPWRCDYIRYTQQQQQQIRRGFFFNLIKSIESGELKIVYNKRLGLLLF